MMNDRENLTEFELISRFFSDIDGGSEQASSSVDLAVGDDCALMTVPEGQQLALSIDTLVAGRHFPETADPYDIARRALAVSVSDLAAMGANPLAFTLALTLPSVESPWLESFSRGLRRAAQDYQIPLIGGDTTKGSLTISLQVHGAVPADAALRRSGAKPTDCIFVTGSLGDAAAALAVIQQELTVSREQQAYLLSRFYAPRPRLAIGEKLRGLATAAIDVSDGLLADLGHICRASGVAAKIYSNKIPLSAVLSAVVAREQGLGYALTGGDDYELCFTAPAKSRQTLATIAGELGVAITEIGLLEEGEGLVCVDDREQPLNFSSAGYQHFS